MDELLASGPGYPETLGWSYFIRGFLAVLQGDWAAARPVLEKAIDASRAAMDPVQLSHSLAMASIAATMAGDGPEADRRVAEAELVAEETDDVPSVVGVLQARALRALFAGDLETLKVVSTEGARLSREVGDLYALHMMNLNLGGAAMFAGDMDESRARYAESLRIAHRIDDRIGLYYLLGALAYHAALAGRAKTAAQLLGASETIRIGAGATVMAVQEPVIAETRERASAALGPARFEAELELGRRMGRDSAVALALGEPATAAAGASSVGDDGLLARREAEVARLVAEGLSNKQIGARLFISERTVDSHVRGILNKLGFNSRAQIAGWVSSGRPQNGR
jgi:DNA-binding CsgD family transcriptional regulator